MVSRPRRSAVFGGDLHKSTRDLAERDDVEFFGSSGHSGQGELRRLSASIRAGMIDRVCIVLRWAGHSEVEAIRALCKAHNIPCKLFRSIGAVRRALGARER